jgi:5-methylcytosine-specific restriction protein A
MGLDHKRHSKRITRTRQWQVLRLAVLERDGWGCMECGARKRLEVHHVKPVRTNPDLSYSLANLKTLCRVCHARTTRIEIGHKPTSPARQAWNHLVQEMHSTPLSNEENHA